jgi:hypothetical protein
VYCTVTTTDTGGETVAAARIVGEEMESWLRQMAGFQGFVLLAGEETAVGIAFWETREVAERYASVRAEFRERILSIAGVEIQDVVDYEVAFARFGPALLAAAGATEPSADA